MRFLFLFYLSLLPHLYLFPISSSSSSFTSNIDLSQFFHPKSLFSGCWLCRQFAYFEESINCIVDVRLLGVNEKLRIFYALKNEAMCISNLSITSRIPFFSMLSIAEFVRLCMSVSTLIYFCRCKNALFSSTNREVYNSCHQPEQYIQFPSLSLWTPNCLCLSHFCYCPHSLCLSTFSAFSQLFYSRSLLSNDLFTLLVLFSILFPFPFSISSSSSPNLFLYASVSVLVSIVQFQFLAPFPS